MFSYHNYPYEKRYYSRKGQIIRRRLNDPPTALNLSQLNQARNYFLQKKILQLPPTSQNPPTDSDIDNPQPNPPSENQYPLTIVGFSESGVIHQYEFISALTYLSTTIISSTKSLRIIVGVFFNSNPLIYYFQSFMTRSSSYTTSHTFTVENGSLFVYYIEGSYDPFVGVGYIVQELLVPHVLAPDGSPRPTSTTFTESNISDYYSYLIDFSQ